MIRIPKPFQRGTEQVDNASFAWRATADGLLFTASGETTAADAFSQSLASREVAALLEQLVLDDLASTDADTTLISWPQLHDLLRSRLYASSLPLLALPEATALVPRLQSSGGYTDPGFTVGISGWLDHDGSVRMIESRAGGMVVVDGKLTLLGGPVWRLLDALDAFRNRVDRERTPEATRRHWASIRRFAIEAEAGLDEFLVRSIVLTPDKLDLDFRKTRVGDTNVVEIVPGFAEAPPRWLEFFDKAGTIGDHFNIPTSDGAVHVVLSEPVRKVLSEIKRLPGRRAAGARAEAFLVNPLAALGEEAGEAIDIDQFAAAKEKAGIAFERFRPHIVTDALGYPAEVGIEIDAIDGEPRCENFESDAELRRFVEALADRLQRGLQLLAWRGYEFELDGEADMHLGALEKALDLRDRPPLVIAHDRVYDLSIYSDRVEGIGEAQPFISAYIVKKSDDDGWFNHNLIALLKFRPPGKTEDITVPLTPEAVPEVRAAIDKAKSEGMATVELAGCPEPLPIADLERAVSQFEIGLREPEPVIPAASDDAEVDQTPAKKPTLLINGNIDHVGYDERREQALAASDGAMEKPRSLRAEVQLRPHQVAGVGRLQQLFRASPEHCRGALLADDMGLGKTLQLLTFISSAFEQDPQLPSALIVAPVALLENWQEEIGRFFTPGTLRTLVAYGDALAALRVPRSQIDASLQQEGLIRFLRPDWRGDANVVLTTYETLRDLEFSFAAEKWSILVCDEAQKLKNPNAMVTRAAKKLEVRFRVACTGTPVENSLTDLWCLFDLVQPGLLGALNEFGKRFGRPIESNGPEAEVRRAELRQLIDPQVIRRMKADVAGDLKRKIEADGCRINMSNEQRALYVGALHTYSKPPEEGEQARLHHLGLLQYLRLVCADPRSYDIETFFPEDPVLYRRKAPKMDWLLTTLRGIEARSKHPDAGDKVLLFAENRDIQRLLQHYIHAEFGFRPRIVNGDTSVSAKAGHSRQKVIRDFQRQQGFGVIILSPLAVGFGVNIQAANHVIHFLRHWNPAKEDQATDRAYRIGQTRDVHVYYPLTVAGDFTTFDVKLDDLLRRKRELSKDMLQGTGDVSGDFDIREIVPGSADFEQQDGPVTPDLIERVSPQFFEALAAALWHKQGYTCHLTPQSDAGVDVVALKGSEGVLIQCKSSSSGDRALGWEAVKEVVGGKAIYAEQYPGVSFDCLCITNRRFNTTAHERAKANNVRLLEQAEVELLVSRCAPTKFDVHAMLSKLRL